MESRELQIHRRIENSPYGDMLENRIRFGDFKPPQSSNDIWEEVLGDDVNNLRHHLDTLELTRKFTTYHRLGGVAAKETLLLTAITHDWGEVVVGDVALPDKEIAGVDEKEVRAHRMITSELIPEYDTERVRQILWGEDELSEPFNAIEYVGYCRTGLRAGKMACLIAQNVVKLELLRKDKDALVGGLLALNKMVELKNYPTLSKYVDKYPSIPRLL